MRWGFATTTILSMRRWRRSYVPACKAALERGLALDPNLVSAAGQLTALQVERGELIKAYQEAKALVERYPQDASAHYGSGIRAALRWSAR